jgi:transposase
LLDFLPEQSQGWNVGDGDDRGRQTMSMAKAAEMLGVSVDMVRRYIDRQEGAGIPVAERERDESGRPVPGSWRRPYLEAMREWQDRRRGADTQQA